MTILEPGEPGGEQAASYGNGTLLNPSSVIPMSSPGIWRKVPAGSPIRWARWRSAGAICLGCCPG